jgi:hypothetical protein
VPQNSITSAAAQAGLTPKQKAQVDGLQKLLDSHKGLLALPAPVAQKKFQSLPQEQQTAHVAMFGGDDSEAPEQKRGWLGGAIHYAGQGVKQSIGRVFGALNEVSDFMTRVYRTGAIALDQGVDLDKAFKMANDKGDQVFSPTRIADARNKYGSDRINVAIKIAQGMPLDQIIAGGTEAEKLIAASAAKGEDKLFQDALDKVQAAKYSPGRQLANLLLPEGLEGSGFLYKGISGFADAAYRVVADPTLLLGKAKKSYDAGNFLLYNLLGKEKFTYGRNLMAAAGNAENIDRVFQSKSVVNFFDTYGKELENLKTARTAKDLVAAEKASSALRRLAPEFGPAAADEFITAGVKNADTAKAYLQNHADVKTILAGQSARKTPLIPRLDAARKSRIAFFTATDKVFSIDKVGQKLVQALYGTGPQYEDIVTGITTRAEDIAKQERQVGRIKGADGAYRMPLAQIQGRIDRFARKFTTIPYFKDGFFDVNAKDASTQVYRLARLGNTRYHSRIIAEAFAAGNEGQRKQIFAGLWNTVAEVRGVSKSAAGKSYMDEFAGSGRNKQYSASIVKRKVNEFGDEVTEVTNPAEFNGQQMAIFAHQLSPNMAVPSIIDLDRLAARSGIIDRVMGVSHSKWAERMTSYWSIGTLAGPRFPVRNAAEDLMLHLAVGDSPWGVAKARLLSTKLRQAKGEGQLGFINKLVYRNQTAKYAARMDEAIASGDTRAAQKVMAEAILESKIVSKLDAEGAELLREIAEYGYLDDTLGAVAEGGKNALRGGDQYLNATTDVSKFGKMGAIIVNKKKLKQVEGLKGYGEFNPVATEEDRIGWLVQIGVISKDELGRIALMNLDNDGTRAVAAVREYLDKLPAKDRERFSLYSTGASTQVHAERVVEATKNLVSKRNGEINDDLLNKIRFRNEKGDMVVSTKDFRVEDLPDKNSLDLAPQWIVGPRFVPISDSDNFAASLVDKTWDYMGEANARFSREPLVIDSMIRIRKDMRATGFEKRIMDQYTRGLEGAKLKAAQDNAKAHIVSIAEDLAKDRVLAFVDNPAVRSQLAMSARNFARFYRATEDFYRRIYRTVKYNPEALTRASLTYEGVAHSGFVQTDDNGDQYFFYPGLTPVYKVMNGVMKAFGVPTAFQVPMPVEFGGKLKMITPSMNPDSLFPTFAGPLASVPMKMVFNVVPQLKSIEETFLGAYGVDQPMVNALLPGHVNRILAALNKDERSSQYASAFRKAATYLEASGHGLKPKIDPETNLEIPPTPAELAAYQERIQSATISVLAVRALFGFIAPASPQVTLKSDLSKWVRDNERTSYKQVFNQLINQYGSIDKAMEEWIRLFPDEMPYTISESDNVSVLAARSVDKSVGWIQENEGLLKKYREGGVFLMPREGDFNFDAYKLLYKSGLKQNKTLQDFLRETQTAKDEQIYYSQRDAFETQLASTYSDVQKRQLRDQFAVWKEQFLGSRPMLQEELGKGAESQIRRLRAYDDLRLMLNDKTVTASPATRAVLSQMSQAFDNYQNARDGVYGNTETAQNYKDLLKMNIKTQLQQLAQGNPNAQAAYDVLFARLIGE